MSKHEKNLQEILTELKSPNIAIIGRSGAGKSTLINSIFGSELAETGTGRPVTKENVFDRYPRYDDPANKSSVILYDSAGYEMGKEKIFEENIRQFLDNKNQANNNIEEWIHLVWYVINSGVKRFEDFEVRIIEHIKYKNEIPIIIILAQDDLLSSVQRAKLREAIINFNLVPNERIINVAAEPIRGESYGVTGLVEKTAELLPELYAHSFIIRQKANLYLKKRTAWFFVSSAALACFSAGFIPIPFSTSLAAAASQSGLIYKLVCMYEFTEFSDLLRHLTIGGSSTLITDLIVNTFDILSYLFPPSYVLNSTIAGGTAASFTLWIGLATVNTLELAAIKYYNTKEAKEEINNFLRLTFKQEFETLRKNIGIIKNKQDIERIKSNWMNSK